MTKRYIQKREDKRPERNWNEIIQEELTNAAPPSPAPAGDALLQGLSSGVQMYTNEQWNIDGADRLMCQAAARITALEATAKEHGNYILKLEAEAIALEAQLADARKALEWYADEDRYADEAWYVTAKEDRGQRARRALATDKEGTS